MIYGNIVEIQQYKSLSKWFGIAVDFLKKTDLATLPCGKTEIHGNHVFVNVMEADTKDAEECRFEVHRKYWDIQIDIEGTEIIQVARDQGKNVEAYHVEADIEFAACREVISCVMGPGKFVVCLDGEPHKPTLNYGTGRHVRKCVIKVQCAEEGEL